MMNPAIATTRAGAHADSLRQRLRARTGERHARLDAHFEGMAAAEDPGLYTRFIRMNEACHRVIEPLLDASPLGGAFVGVRSRNIADALGEDLREANMTQLSPPPFPVPAPDLAEAVGIAYVIEGSRLGARFILHEFRSRELGPEWGSVSFSYLKAAAERSLFRDFMIRASEILVAEAEQDRSCVAANAAFDYVLGLARACYETAVGQAEQAGAV